MAEMKKETIVLLYDFDGTLCPGSMQDTTILPELGFTGDEFWGMVNTERKASGGDSTLTYMYVLLREAKARGKVITRELFNTLAAKIKFYKGVEEYFTRINNFVNINMKGWEVKHYVLSSGIKELIEGCAIAKEFSNVFACEYFYDKDGNASFPKYSVNYTDKTQYIFRISKGREKPGQNVNEIVPAHERAVPIANMLYIGDGMTDIPCMKIVRENGGKAMVVYDAQDEFSIKISEAMARDKRADFFCEADYSAGSKIDTVVKQVVLNIAARNIL